MVNSYYQIQDDQLVRERYNQIIQPNCLTEVDRNVNETCQKIKSTKKWADAYEIYGLAKEFGVIVKINYSDASCSSQLINRDLNKPNQPVLDFHYVKGLHYKSLQDQE